MTEIVTAVVAGFASIAAIVYIWWKRPSVRLVNEVILEVALVVLLGIAISNFADDTAHFVRKRIKVSVAVMYASGVISTLGFGVTIALSCLRDCPALRNISRRISQGCWFIFLFTSIAAYVAYMTVVEETDAANSGAGEATITGIFNKRWYSWKDTSAYHELTHKILLTISAAALMIFPIIVFSGSSTPDDPENISDTDMVNLLVDILAAGIHRMNLASDKERLSDTSAEGGVGDRNSGKDSSLPIPATSGAVPSTPLPVAAERPPVMEPTQPLPGGWLVARDAQNRLYYHHPSTGATTWSWPAEAAPVGQPHAAPHVAHPAAGSSAARLASGWASARAPNGRIYYYHAASGSTSWVVPSV